MRIASGLLVLFLVVAGAAGVHAEDLNEKFGENWNCGYISAGLPLREACEKANCDFSRQHFWRDSPSSGHCVDVKSLPSQPRTDTYSVEDKRRQDEIDAYWKLKRAAPPVHFSALAGAAHCYRGGCQVSAGSAIGGFNTRAAAEAAALSKCREKGVPGCQIVTSWGGSGCGYITGGTIKRANGSTGASTFSSHNSREEAASKCRAAGYQCDEVIGGCGH
jgi:hypothetical protein